MLPDLHSILRNRRRLGLTQSELARLAGVSQSLVAKIEAGRLDPAYSKAKHLLDVLDQLSRREEKRAKEVMHSPVSSVKTSELLFHAVSLMRRHGFSQLPVEDVQGKMVGSLSERSVIERLEQASVGRGRTAGSLDSKHVLVSEIMDEPFPTVSELTPVSAIAHLLHDSPAVLVLRKGKPAGIVTKADLLKVL